MGWSNPCWYRMGRWCFDAPGTILPGCSGWHSQEASLWTSQCGSVQAAAQGTLPLLVCLTWVLCQAVPQSQSCFCPRVPGSAPWASCCSDSDHQLWGQTSKAEPVPSGEPVKGGFLTPGLENSYNFNNRFLWARLNCLWQLTETCLGRITECPVDSALPSGVFGCEHQPCCSAWTGAWLTSCPSAAAGKSLLINSFSTDNHLSL